MSRKGRGTGQGKRLVSFLVVMVLIAGFALTLVPPAHAADSYNMTVLQSAASSSSITTYTTGAYNTVVADTVFVLYSDCLGSNAPAISSVTDTLGDVWIHAVSIGTPVTGGGSVPATTQEIWYAVGKSGSNAVTVTFASSCSAGYIFTYAWINSPAVTVADSWSSGSAPSAQVGTCTGCVNLNGLLYPSKLMKMPSSNSFVLAAAAEPAMPGTNSYAGGYGTCTVAQTGTPALIQEYNRWGQCSIYTGNGLPYYSFQNWFNYFANPQSTSYQFSVTMGPGLTQFSAVSMGWSVAVVVLSPTGVFPINCNPSCQITGGGTIQAAGSLTLTGNQTYLYEGTSGPTGLTINTVNTNVAAYTNGGGGKGTATFYLLLYSMQPGIMLSNYAISSGTPLSLIASKSYTITTGSTNQAFTWNPSAAISGNTSYAIGIIVNYAGLSITNAVNTATLYNDTVDALVNGVMPTLTQPNPGVHHIYLNWVATMAANYNVVTVTTIGGGTGATATVTATVYYSNCSQDPNACSQTFLSNIASYLPLIFLSLVLGAIFDIPGFLFGLMLGTIIETGMGVFPVWVIALVVFGMFMFIWKGSSIPRLRG